MVDSSKKRIMAGTYGYERLAAMQADDIPYDIEDTTTIDGLYHVHAVKKIWGGYNLCYATILATNGDTLFSRIALAGIGKDITDSTAILIFNNRTPAYLGSNVTINGNCYFPESALRHYQSGDSKVAEQRIYKSPDTVTTPRNIASLVQWATDYNDAALRGSKLYLSDSVYRSFYSPTYNIAADTVILSGKLSGNIIVSANVIEVERTCSLSNVLLTGRKIIVADHFKGNMQVIATDTVILNTADTITYPGFVALLPDAGKNHCKVPCILMRDSVNICGDVYAYTADTKLFSALQISSGAQTRITGSMYSSLSLQLNGTYHGHVICRTIAGNQLSQDNLLSDLQVDVDSLPSYFAYCNLFPLSNKRRIVKWLEGVRN